MCFFRLVRARWKSSNDKKTEKKQEKNIDTEWTWNPKI